jgi:hypothetical protein
MDILNFIIICNQWRRQLRVTDALVPLDLHAYTQFSVMTNSSTSISSQKEWLVGPQPAAPTHGNCN